MSTDVVARIFTEFKFRSLTASSSKNLLYKTIINTAFGANIICSECDDNDNIHWFINEDLADCLYKLEQLCKNCSNQQVLGGGCEVVICEDEEDSKGGEMTGLSLSSIENTTKPSISTFFHPRG